ncbi:hypothetical protein [Pasteuria penetrans]|uniref:hypothetical protein n=1 Tax=Pasteuria penetrans TaxID=86005 RepID=UPI000FBD04B6|nr:hypothetical protein [Pasteuria penetrans]
MKQPLKEKLSEKLNEKGMKVDIQSARLSKLVPTTDTPEEIRNALKDSPLSAYVIGHAIVDKESGQKVGALVSTIDGPLSSPIAFVKHNENGMDVLYVMSPSFEGGAGTCSSRAKRGVSWEDVGDCLLEALVPGGTGGAGSSALYYHTERVTKKAAKKATLKMAAKLFPGDSLILIGAEAAVCMYDKKS